MLLIGVGFSLMTPIGEKNVVQDTKNVVQDRQSFSAFKTGMGLSEVHTPESYAQQMVSEAEYEALFELIMLESNWNPEAQNPKSSAYGLGQLLDQTWDLVGIEKSTNFKVQLIATHKYVMERYGSWQKALEFRKANGYY